MLLVFDGAPLHDDSTQSFVDLLHISGFPVHVRPKIKIEVCALCYLFVIVLSSSVNLFSFLILSFW